MKGHQITVLISIEPEDHIEVRLVGDMVQISLGGGPTLMLHQAVVAENLARAALTARTALADHALAVNTLAPHAGELPTEPIIRDPQPEVEF